MDGADIIARPMATICCSPPLMVRAIWFFRSLSLETVPERPGLHFRRVGTVRNAPSANFRKDSSLNMRAFLAPVPILFPRPVCGQFGYLNTVHVYLTARSAEIMPPMASERAFNRPLAPRMTTISRVRSENWTPSKA